MRSYEFSAKSVEKAIKLGLQTLNKKQEDVDIKIISEGGLFKKAKIVINIEDEPKRTNFAPKAEQLKEQPKEKVAETKQPAKPEKKPEPKVEQKLDKKQDSTVQAKPQKVQEQKVANDAQTQGELAEQKAEPAQEPAPEKPQIVRTNNQTSVEFVKGLVNAMNLNAGVELKETKDNSQITISLEDVGAVIGYRGECLSAIQYLANVVEQKQNRTAKRVVIDAGDYKVRREQKLRDMAIKIAGKVEATGRAHKFEPMNAYERRIIHTELQNYSGVETHSEGVEPRRRLVVTKRAK